MCGILVGKELTQNQINSISHRGIEYNVIKENGITMCHHRLPIQTVDGDGWHQPVKIGENRYLLFNGEIFNYPSQYDSDTEYLQKLFSNFQFGGLSMFEAIFKPHVCTWDGFWAIVLIDTKSKDVYAFTDPLGKKSLYRDISEGTVCSEIKGLIKGEEQVNGAFISGVLKNGYLTSDETPFKNFVKVPNNSFVLWNLNNPSVTEKSDLYYDFYSFHENLNSYEDRMDWLWNKLEESVKSRLISKNYPTSLLLSGGLDSSIIGGLLLKLGASVQFYSIENGEDEEYVRECEDYWEIKSNRLKYSMDQGSENLDILRDIYKKWNESPVDLGSVVPQYYLFKSIKEGSKTRIVISGDGADELFGGYRRINEYDSQLSDIFHELTYYHLPRLDKLSMAHTLELRNPFLNLDIVRFAISLPFEERKNKKILKDTFRGLVPDSVIERKKLALKNPMIVEDPIRYREKSVDLYLF